MNGIINLIGLILSILIFLYLFVYFFIKKGYSLKYPILLFLVLFYNFTSMEIFVGNSRILTIIFIGYMISLIITIFLKIIILFVIKKRISSFRKKIILNLNKKQIEKFIKYVKDKRISYKLAKNLNFDQDIKQTYYHIINSSKISIEAKNDLYRYLASENFYVNKPTYTNDSNIKNGSIYEFNKNKVYKRISDNYSSAKKNYKNDNKIITTTFLRTTLEHLVKWILSMNDIKFSENNTLHENLILLRNKKIIKDKHIDYMFLIKDVGNKGTHQSSEDDILYAKTNVKIAYSYMEKLINAYL